MHRYNYLFYTLADLHYWTCQPTQTAKLSQFQGFLAWSPCFVLFCFFLNTNKVPLPYFLMSLYLNSFNKERITRYRVLQQWLNVDPLTEDLCLDLSIHMVVFSHLWPQFVGVWYCLFSSAGTGYTYGELTCMQTKLIHIKLFFLIIERKQNPQMGHQFPKQYIP